MMKKMVFLLMMRALMVILLMVNGDGDVYLCDSELRGILDQQKNYH